MFLDLVSVVLQAVQFLQHEGLAESDLEGLRISIGEKLSDGGYEIRLYEP